MGLNGNAQFILDKALQKLKIHVYIPNMPSYANLANLKLMEGLYQAWRKEPQSVDPSWIPFFEGLELGSGLADASLLTQGLAEVRISALIDAYRRKGHIKVQSNPIASASIASAEGLALSTFGFTEEDLDLEFPTCGFLKEEKASLQTIVASLEKTYCDRIGIEYMYMDSLEAKRWIQSQIEPGFPLVFSSKEKLNIAKQLRLAQQFETFLHTKYVGQKRFSLEGAETLIVALHAILERATKTKESVSTAILGMAHRGRLNVLANVLGKSYEYIFEEFEDKVILDLEESSGDVKYHMGFIGSYKGEEGEEIRLILSANPSHLESVNPVVEGGVRALQDLLKKEGRDNPEKKILPILIHGDAAIAGQGVVYETLTLSQLEGYKTGGTIHIVVNNNIGFTTSPKEARSTRYCTDIAKAFKAPVLHVNAEDPEACSGAARLSIEIRQRFGCDVFIDLVGYRKYGHNEGDEPSFTQPLEYQEIKERPSIRQIYKERLLEELVITAIEGEEEEKAFAKSLTAILEKVKSKPSSTYELIYERKKRDLDHMLSSFASGVKIKRLQDLGEALTRPPASFHLHPKIERLLKERRKMVESNSSLVDWAMAELLAYGSLATEEKKGIRLSGQDVGRGTFSHRHSLYVDQIEGSSYYPLSHLFEGQAAVEIFNSPLSEFAVLGFEFGYSLMHPSCLVIWEAQYGDFANSAQVVIDQYIASSEMKWGHRSGLTLLLPHGYAGSGPEHSSARVERYLQLCAEGNMTVAHCSSPAQFFHLIRRQALRPLQKPLIVFTPKEILRHPRFKSPLEDLAEGQFEEILVEGKKLGKEDRKTTALILCSGKIYYDLLEEREKQHSSSLIATIEQLYPLHLEKLRELLTLYPHVKEWIWAQEEPENMGPWGWIKPQLEHILQGKISLRYAGRQKSAVTATGSPRLHQLESQRVMKEVFQEQRPR